MLHDYNFIDLTHLITPTIPTWDGTCGFKMDIKSDYKPEDEIKFRVQNFQICAGLGTHMDSPSHCIAGIKSIAELTLNELITPCFVINVT